MTDDILPGLPEQYQATLLLSIGTVELAKERFISEINAATDIKNRVGPLGSIPTDETNKKILEAMGALADSIKELGESLAGLRRGLAEEMGQAKAGDDGGKSEPAD